MTRPAGAVLYTPEILQLAVSLADYPFDETAACTGSARSRTCGSEIEMSSARPDRIGSLGIRAKACAIGQASAAIFAAGADGATPAAIENALREIEGWLAGTGQTPSWPGIAALQPAIPHAARHAAILLPWKAACSMLCKPGPGR